MAKITAKKRRTLIKIAVKNAEYDPGTGTDSKYLPISAQIGTQIGENNEEIPVLTDCFYCEWQNLYGAMAITLEQQGIQKPARVRMTYIKELFEALNTENAKILKDGKDDPQHAYMLASSPNDELEEGKLIEFQVKQWSAK